MMLLSPSLGKKRHNIKTFNFKLYIDQDETTSHHTCSESVFQCTICESVIAPCSVAIKPMKLSCYSCIKHFKLDEWHLYMNGIASACIYCKLVTMHNLESGVAHISI